MKKRRDRSEMDERRDRREIEREKKRRGGGRDEIVEIQEIRENGDRKAIWNGNVSEPAEIRR
jgi:hypothetical protein